MVLRVRVTYSNVVDDRELLDGPLIPVAVLCCVSCIIDSFDLKLAMIWHTMILQGKPWLEVADF